MADTVEVKALNCLAAEEVEEEAFEGAVLFIVVKLRPGEKEERLVAHLRAPGGRPEGLAGAVACGVDCELHHVEDVVVEKTPHDDAVGTLLVVPCNAEKTQVLRPAQTLHFAVVLEGVRLHAGAKFYTVGLLQRVL